MRSIQETRAALKRDSLNRIRELRSLLDTIQLKIERDHLLNDLGEMQGVAVILDCRLSSLATVQQLLLDNSS